MSLHMILPNGLILWGQDRVQKNGFYINEGEFEWFSGVDMRRDEIARAQAHGSFDTPGFLTSRVFTVDGFAIADTADELENMGNQIKGVLVSGGSGRVVVEWNDVTTWADVRLSGQTKFVPDPSGLAARFRLQFWAANPRKFGEIRTFAGGTPAYHYGNFPASPVFTVSGARVGGYTVSGSDGTQFTVTSTVVNGFPHVIDTATGLRTVAGIVWHGGVTRADLSSIPAGGQVTYTVIGAGLTLSTTVADTLV